MAVEEPANGRPDDLRFRARAALASLSLDESPHEAQARLGEIVRMRDRLEGLLESVLAVVSGLELDSTLQRIVRAATELVGARYGALGVLDEKGSLVEFVYAGDDETRTKMAPLPESRALSDLLSRSRGPVRLPDLSRQPAWADPPGDHSPRHSFLGVPVRARGEVFSNLYLLEKRGDAEFTVEDEVALQALAAAAGVGIDNTRLFEQSRMRERWLGAVTEINGELLGGASVEATLDLVVRRVCELVDAEDAFILLASDEDSAAMSVGVSTGRCSSSLTTLSVDLRECSVIAAAMREERPRLLPELESALPDDPAVTSAGLGPGAVVPLTSATGLGGALVVARSKGAAAFTTEQLPMLTALAGQAAVALEFAEKQRSQWLADLFDERDRIAQNLHDHVIQRLFTTAMNLQGTLRRIDDRNVRLRVEQVVEQLDTTVREIRTSVFDLHTVGVHGESGLRRRLLDIVEELTADTDVTPTMRLSGSLDMLVPRRVGEHAEAVVREAVSNALRHSGGETVRVAAEADEHRLSVEVADNGVGMPENAHRSGLENLWKRARQCGGELVVDHEPGGGTRVVWRVPL
ncbi:GAF domain-containing protein [Saccharomonospora sp.]|uniref:sensor histidine kinase n=1 Tax=Saccharomonospora sp. TaxID=33913 RepID=UPI0026092CAE|nr:GAF domain-containing protein [Saccharomonospora sp.]